MTPGEAFALGCLVGAGAAALFVWAGTWNDRRWRRELERQERDSAKLGKLLKLERLQ